MKWLVRRVLRRMWQQKLGGHVTPSAGRCGPCRELLGKRPATVLRTEHYQGAARDTGGRS